MSAFWDWMHGLTPMSACMRLLFAAVLGGLIGMERGRHGRAAGMRTHILVCIGSALTALVGLYAVQVLTLASDPLRVGAQVISGIGFLGAGTILIKDRFQVTGLTTAAGLWATAAIGLAIGVGYYEAALFTALVVLAANAILPRMERNVKSRNSGGHIYVELSDARRVVDLVDWINAAYGAESMQVSPSRSGIDGHLGVELELFPIRKRELSGICRELMEQDYVAFAVNVQ